MPCVQYCHNLDSLVRMVVISVDVRRSTEGAFRKIQSFVIQIHQNLFVQGLTQVRS